MLNIIYTICKPGVTVFLCGVAIAILRERCHAPTIMLTNFVITPLELRLFAYFKLFFIKDILQGKKDTLYGLESSNHNLNAIENNLIRCQVITWNFFILVDRVDPVRTSDEMII